MHFVFNAFRLLSEWGQLATMEPGWGGSVFNAFRLLSEWGQLATMEPGWGGSVFNAFRLLSEWGRHTGRKCAGANRKSSMPFGC